MPMRRSIFRSLLLAVALAAGAGKAGATEASFDFTIAGIRVGTLVLDADDDGNNYDATARIDTAGVIGMFADFFFDGSATGTVSGDGTVVPLRYTATSKSPRALRHSLIEWKNGTPVTVSVKPPRSSAPDPADQHGALDPVSAGFRLFRDAPPEDICDTVVYIFDGSRRSRLAFDPPVADGDRLTCAGRYARVEGEPNSIADLREFPFSVVFRRNAEGVAQLQRIEAPTSFGTAVIKRRG